MQNDGGYDEFRGSSRASVFKYAEVVPISTLYMTLIRKNDILYVSHKEAVKPG